MGRAGVCCYNGENSYKLIETDALGSVTLRLGVFRRLLLVILNRRVVFVFTVGLRGSSGTPLVLAFVSMDYAFYDS